MPRQRDSLFGPIAFVIVASVFAAGAGYSWWLDYRSPAQAPLADLHAASAPAFVPQALTRPAPRYAPASPQRAAPATPTVLRCIGADGVPIFTSAACPEGSRLDKRVAVDVRDPPRGSPPPPAPAPVPGIGATAVATVNNYGHPGYYADSPQDERRYEREQAERRCERARLRERSELLALGLERKMKHIREWGDYVVRECATYQVLSRRH